MTGRSRHPPLALLALASLSCEGSQADVLVVRCQSAHMDPYQQGALEPGDRSHWLQPWRAYVDTWPARRMREAATFSISSGDGRETTTKLDLLGAAGLSRAVFQIQWADVDPVNPARLGSARTEKRQALQSMRERGIRPVILLDAYHDPPHRGVTLTLTASAPEGATTLRLDAASAGQVVPGRTLLETDSQTKQMPFIRSVDGAGLATLTRPLRKALPAGKVAFQIVTFLPFPRPVLPDGRRNPAFAEPMNGWLQFIAAVAAEARDVLGNDRFDMVVFNGSGSPVLDINNYFEPPPADAATSVEMTMEEILKQTVAWVREPRNGISGARLIDGFSNSRYSEAGSTEIAGVDGFSRTLSANRVRFPAEAPGTARWLNAAGRPSGQRRADGAWQPGFVPAYEAHMPEIFLHALDSKQLWPDLSPVQSTDTNGVIHGRSSAPAGAPAPDVAITAFVTNLDKEDNLTAIEARHFTTKAVLRALSAYVGKGVGSLTFFESNDATELIVPGEIGGGETVIALKRFLAAFDGPAQSGPVRGITLTAVGDCSGAQQFEGDGTAVHPALRDRDVVAFFPFRVTDDRVVAPVYVMTRDLGRVRPAEGQRFRHDLPERDFTLTIQGVRGDSASISAFDPVTGAATTVTMLRRSARGVQVRLPLTDSPRVLRIEDF